MKRRFESDSVDRERKFVKLSYDEDETIASDFQMFIKKSIDRQKFLDRDAFEEIIENTLRTCIWRIRSSLSTNVEKKRSVYTNLNMILEMIFGKDTSTEEMIYLFMRMNDSMQEIITDAYSLLESSGNIDYQFQLFSNMISEKELREIQQSSPSDIIQFIDINSLDTRDLRLNRNQLSHLDYFFMQKHQKIIKNEHQKDDTSLISEEYANLFVSMCLIEKRILDDVINSGEEYNITAVRGSAGTVYLDNHASLFGIFGLRKSNQRNFICFMLKYTANIESVHMNFFQEHGFENQYIEVLINNHHISSLHIEKTSVLISEDNLDTWLKLISNLKEIRFDSSIMFDDILVEQTFSKRLANSKILEKIIFHGKFNFPFFPMKYDWKSTHLKYLDISLDKINQVKVDKAVMDCIHRHVDAIDASIFEDTQWMIFKNIKYEDEDIREIMEHVNKLRFRKKIHLTLSGTMITEKSLEYINNVDSEIESFEYGFSDDNMSMETSRNHANIFNALIYGEYSKLKNISISIQHKMDKTSFARLIDDFTMKSLNNKYAETITVSVLNYSTDIKSYRLEMNRGYYERESHFPMMRKSYTNSSLQDTIFKF